MRPVTRLLTVLVSGVALLAPAAVANAAPWFHPPRIDWAPCDEDPTAECGTLRVPLDWSRPHGPKIDLALARRPATDPEARIGSLVINPGGPGGSGIDFVVFGGGFFTDELRRRFDLVGFDPRGVARSHPVRCSLDLLLAEPFPVPASRAEFETMIDYYGEVGEDCRARTGPIIDHVDTLSVVRDLDTLRGALGDRALTYYGVSYGTLIGQQYAERYPYRVRALALDSNMDHSIGVRDFLYTQTRTVQDSFDEFVAWCDRTADCALHGQDVRAVWGDLLARADRGELTDPADPAVRLSAFDLISGAFSTFYGPEWGLLAEAIAAFDPDADVPSGAAAPLLGGYQDEEVDYVFPATFCADWDLKLRGYREYERHLRRMARLAPDMRYSPLAVTATVACQGWPGEVTNPQHRLRVPPGPKLLLVNAVHDPATGYEWATGAARQLGRRAVLLTYEGWGHQTYRGSPCVTDAIDDYLISLDLPRRGARCPAVEPGITPFRAPAPSPLPPGPHPAVPGWTSGP